MVEDDYRTFSEKRQIIKMDLVKEADYTSEVIICVPDFAWSVARSLLEQYGQWRTTYAMEYYDQGYRIPNFEEWDTISASISAFLEARDMSCDLKESLDCICNAVQEVAAATYSGNVGSNYLPAGDLDPVPFVDDGEAIPDGFDTYEEYQDYKCQIASTIWYELRTDYNTMATVDMLALGGALALAPLLITGVPGLLLVTGYVIFTTSVAAGTAFFSEAVSQLDLLEEQLICSLFNALDVTQARDNFLGVINTESSWSNTLFAGTFAQTAALWLNNTNLNALFSSDPGRDLRPYDCSVCGPAACPEIDVQTGQLISHVAGQVVIQSVLSSGRQRVNLNFNYDYPDYCGPLVQINSVSPGVTPQASGEPVYRFFDQNNVLVYTSNSAPSSPVQGVAWISLVTNNVVVWTVFYTDPTS